MVPNFAAWRKSWLISRFFKEGWTLKLLVVNKSIYYWANLGTTNRE